MEISKILNRNVITMWSLSVIPSNKGHWFLFSRFVASRFDLTNIYGVWLVFLLQVCVFTLVFVILSALWKHLSTCQSCLGRFFCLLEVNWKFDVKIRYLIKLNLYVWTVKVRLVNGVAASIRAWLDLIWVLWIWYEWTLLVQWMVAQFGFVRLWLEASKKKNLNNPIKMV